MVNKALGSDLVPIQLHPDGVFQIGSDQPIDFIRHGRCKEQRLMFMDQTGHDEVHIFNKAHLQHFVGFIQDQGVHSREVDGRGIIKEINQSPGGGDKDMDPISQFGFLNLHRKSTEDRKRDDLPYIAKSDGSPPHTEAPVRGWVPGSRPGWP